MMAALPHLKGVAVVLRIKHQTGAEDIERVKAAYLSEGWGERADVASYIDNMVGDFAEADLVICRAGATTTAELIAAGKAAIMIPFPFASEDHQKKNAEALQAAGAARMILQQDLSDERLAKEIVELVQAPEKVSAMEQAVRKLARGDAAVPALDMIEDLAEGEVEQRTKYKEQRT